MCAASLELCLQRHYVPIVRVEMIDFPQISHKLTTLRRHSMRNIIIFQGMLDPNVVNIIQRQHPSSYRMTVRNMYTNATHHARANIVGVRARVRPRLCWLYLWLCALICSVNAHHLSLSRA